MQLDLLFKRIAMKFGVDVRVYSPARSEAARLAKLLARHNIDLVLDVGANQGQYARYLRTIGYCGRIVCFEPLSDAFAILSDYARKDHKITIAPRMALGDHTGSVSINVAANSESSSLLTVSDTHIKAEPLVKSIRTETVPINRLDEIASDYVADADSVFLKIDVQGYELSVLRGAGELLLKIRGIQLELSLEPLYEGELLYREMIETVESAGFELYDLNPCFSDNITGKTYQLDGIFFRK
jgi:FkbM family methyltransferase